MAEGLGTHWSEFVNGARLRSALCDPKFQARSPKDRETLFDQRQKWERLNKTCDDLSQKIAEATSSRDETRSVADQMEELQVKISEADSLKREAIREVTKQKEDAEAKTRSITEQLEQLRNKISEANRSKEEAIREATKHQEDAEAESSRVQEELTSVKDQLATAKANADSAKNGKEDAEAIAAQLRVELTDAKGKLDIWNKDGDNLRGHIKLLEQEMVARRQAIEALDLGISSDEVQDLETAYRKHIKLLEDELLSRRMQVEQMLRVR